MSTDKFIKKLRFYKGITKCYIIGKSKSDSRKFLVKWSETGKYKGKYVFINDTSIISNIILLEKNRRVKRRIKW